MICHNICLRMRNVSDKTCKENQKTYFIFSNFVFQKSCCFKIMYKNKVEPDRPQMIQYSAERCNLHAS